MADLWHRQDREPWQRALDAYAAVVAAQGGSQLVPLDTWYHASLPGLMAARTPVHCTHDELVRVTEWKMHRGVWRAPNLVRVKGNDAALVVATTARALAQRPHPTAPVKEIATLDGVGPATASAVLAAVSPELYPFFDELVAAQVEGLGVVAWTLGYYAKYAAALRERAAALGAGWTAAMVERALWSNAGGKAGVG